MAQINYIKDAYENEEKSIRQIAKDTGHAYTTVSKYAKQDDWNQRELSVIDQDNFPILGPFIAVIDEWLESDRRIKRKQRHTVKRIYERLVEEHGFTGSYSSVGRYIRKKKRHLYAVNSEGSLPISSPAAHAQVDFGSIQYFSTSGELKDGYELVVTFPYSNKGYTQVFPSQNQECLLEGLKRVWNHIGGVPLQLRADNMSTAVVHIGQGTERTLSEGFYRFKLHYGFQVVFCNPGKGNEKGNVENKVGYARRNFLVPVPTIDDFDEFNKLLFERCEADAQREHYTKGKTVSVLWEEEKAKLLCLPAYEYQVFRYEVVKLNQYGQATIETNRYGLSPAFAHQKAQAKTFHDKIELYIDHQLLKTYPRCYGRNQEMLDWRQYLGALLVKPRAVEHTRFFNQIPHGWQHLLRDTQGKERKSALCLLQEIVTDGNENICNDIIEMAKDCGRTEA